jgi:hypothetical protein
MGRHHATCGNAHPNCCRTTECDDTAACSATHPCQPVAYPFHLWHTPQLLFSTAPNLIKNNTPVIVSPITMHKASPEVGTPEAHHEGYMRQRLDQDEQEVEQGDWLPQHLRNEHCQVEDLKHRGKVVQVQERALLPVQVPAAVTRNTSSPHHQRRLCPPGRQRQPAGPISCATWHHLKCGKPCHPASTFKYAPVTPHCTDIKCDHHTYCNLNAGQVRHGS